MDIGKITERKVGKNRDGNSERIILQVEVIKNEDVRSVELFTQAGEDTNPADGARVNIIPISDSYQISAGISDDLPPEVDIGEKEFYSTDNPATQRLARIKLGADSVITLNQGVDYAVKWSELNIVLQALVTAINAAFALKLNGAGATGGLTLDLTSVKVDKVKL